MKSENLITLEELVKRAKKSGVDFGKSDPYNRLRYYTKISLLPHMERRKGKTGDIAAYYPQSALEKLIKIEKLKERGLANETILREMEKEDNSFSKYFKNKINFTNISLSLAALLFGLTLLHQRGVINLSYENNQSVAFEQNDNDLRIIDSGVYSMKAGRRKTFVKSKKISELSQVQVTFKDSISPATNYWIEDKVPQEGFVLTLDNNTAAESSFSWWVVH
ncbi:MerR family transcriptional regulator [candidate division WWE3 bacterium]|nr:MerR family transcriptional regulator [candidate division WWE3 bacterium]